MRFFVCASFGERASISLPKIEIFHFVRLIGDKKRAYEVKVSVETRKSR
jgi:hypothetical protein